MVVKLFPCGTAVERLPVQEERMKNMSVTEGRVFQSNVLDLYFQMKFTQIGSILG